MVREMISIAFANVPCTPQPPSRGAQNFHAPSRGAQNFHAPSRGAQNFHAPSRGAQYLKAPLEGGWGVSGISTSYFPKPKLRLRFLALLLVFFALPRLTSAQPDVQAYQLRLETELSEGKITGREIITFLLQNEDLKATFDCGDLKVETIEGAGFLGFEQQNQQLIISLSPVPDKLYELEITYHGNPRRGIEFYPDLQQVNSAYFTSEWMICNPLPDDRAIFSLDLIVEDSLVGIANGELRAWEKLENGKSKYSWQQAFPSPAYTFGFIIGDLKLFEEMHGNTSLTYYAQHYSPSELKQIFRETASMLDFFEAKAGVSYPLSSYRQVLGEGAVSQEYGGFTIMRKKLWQTGAD